VGFNGFSSSALFTVAELVVGYYDLSCDELWNRQSRNRQLQKGRDCLEGLGAETISQTTGLIPYLIGLALVASFVIGLPHA
jgi:hypothetical protein